VEPNLIKQVTDLAGCPQRGDLVGTAIDLGEGAIQGKYLRACPTGSAQSNLGAAGSLLLVAPEDLELRTIEEIGQLAGEFVIGLHTSIAEA